MAFNTHPGLKAFDGTSESRSVMRFSLKRRVTFLGFPPKSTHINSNQLKLSQNELESIFFSGFFQPAQKETGAHSRGPKNTGEF